MKQILTIDELIEHMKLKGIKFDICSEEEAKRFLRKDNYYFKVASYRKLYPKVINSELQKDKYQNLDFAYLIELTKIDDNIREFIWKMCSQIEQQFKTNLVNKIEDVLDEDGYEIVKHYLQKEDQNFNILRNINKHKSGRYSKDLIEKYYPYIPIWVLVELISFGELIRLIQFYEKEKNINLLPKNSFINVIRDFRNAAAHGNSLINNLLEKMDDSTQPDIEVVKFVQELEIVSNVTRRKNLRKLFNYNFTVLLYVYWKIVPITKRKKVIKELDDYLLNVQEKRTYFNSNSQLMGIYNFIFKLVDKLNSRV